MITHAVAEQNLVLLAHYSIEELGVGEDGMTLERGSKRTEGLQEVIHETFAYAKEMDLTGARLWVKEEIGKDQVRFLSPGNILRRLQNIPDKTRALNLPDEEKIQQQLILKVGEKEEIVAPERAIALINSHKVTFSDIVKGIGSVTETLPFFTEEQWERILVLDLKNVGLITNDDFNHLVHRCPNLDYLSVPPSVTGDVLRCLSGTKKLTTLDISYCIELDNDSLRHLQYVPSLYALRMVSCTSLRTDSLMYLDQVVKLKVLDISECLLEKGALNYLQAVPDLRELYMRECFGLEKEALMHLEVVPKLEVLDLSSVDYLETNCLRHLVFTPHLKTLKIDWCAHYESLSLTYLEHLKELEELSLKGCFQLEPRVLETLEQVSKLRHLNVGGCFQLSEPEEPFQKWVSARPTVRVIG